MSARGFLVVLALGLAACSSGEGDECGAPAYDGNASDEAWLVMIDQESHVKSGDPKASAVETPSEGQIFHATDAPPTLRWTTPLMASTTPARKHRAPSAPSLWDLFEGTAYAHLPPVTGVIHDLKITVPGRKCPLEIFTTATSYGLTATQWSILSANGGQPLSLQITSAYLRENRVTEGPYRPATARTFQVTP